MAIPNPTDERPSPPPPLQGVRVLELSGTIAAGFAGRYLRGYGADVVRVPIEGRAGPTADERRYLHAGKRALLGEGDAVRRLALAADIVVEDAPLEVLDGWGCLPADLPSPIPEALAEMLGGKRHWRSDDEEPAAGSTI